MRDMICCFADTPAFLNSKMEVLWMAEWGRWQHLLAPALLKVCEHVKCDWTLQPAVHVVPGLPRPCTPTSQHSLNKAHATFELSAPNPLYCVSSRRRAHSEAHERSPADVDQNVQHLGMGT